ncbi:MAG: hypothetical protein RL291_777 [Pseudomonadota bacterium]
MTTRDDDNLPLDAWNEAISEISDNGRERRRTATDAQRKALAETLDLVDVAQLQSTYRIKPLSRARFHIEGTVTAQVTQTCVVTLEPVPGSVDENFALEFWPDTDLPDAPTGEVEIAHVLDIEGYARGALPIGRIVYETFAAGLDPNPRAQGAAFDWRDPKAGADSEGGKTNPFAALKSLKLEPKKTK